MDDWTSILDRWRCRAVDRILAEVDRDVTRRCQLYAGHVDAHAHAVRLPGKRWRAVAYRWDDMGAQWSENRPSDRGVGVACSATS